MILVSPAEPPAIRKHFEVSSLCEQYGADFLFTSPAGMVGVQRKEVRDLVASIRDDRIARELGQSRPLAKMVLVVEGDWKWGRDGGSKRVEGFTRPQFDGLMLSFQHHGWWVLHTLSMADTVRTLRRAVSWFGKENHDSLVARPKPSSPWGSGNNRDWAAHLLQSFDGLGVRTAHAIYDHFGKAPLAWTVTERQLLDVPGVGKQRARTLILSLQQEPTECTEPSAPSSSSPPPSGSSSG
jgi:ERCC4-type nuclease